MKKLMSMALIVAMGAVACQKEGPDYADNSTPTNGDYLTFTADFVKLASKTAASFDESDNTLTLSWEEGDQVGIYSAQTPILFKATTSGASTTLTSNVKVASASSYSAVYPYMTDALMEGGSLMVAVPAEQTAVADSPKYHVAVAKTSSDALAFKNVTAAIRLNLIAENVTKIELKANGGENISGVAAVNTENAAISSLSNGTSVITLVPQAGASAINPGIYYVSVVPQTLSQGFTVTYHVGANSFEQTAEEAFALDGNTLVVCEGFGTAVEGSQSNPFTVGSIEDLKALSSKLAFDVPNYVVMTKDIDMKGAGAWTPICNSRTLSEIPELHFDGRNHTISNFAPTSVSAGTGGDQASFFGVLYGSCKNLKFIGAALNVTSMSTVAVVAAFAGYEGKTGVVTKFENVHVDGVVNAKKVVAGLVANACNAEFRNCSADVDATASDNHVGGFVGRSSGDTSFEGCHATGDVKNTKSNGRYTAGFYGGDEAYPVKLSFKKCYATGNVTGSYQTGAFAGYVKGGTCEIINCYATGNIVAFGTSKQYGGILGVNNGTPVTITDSYYAGTITSNKAETVGGIIGLNAAGTATVTRCFAVADLTAPTYAVGGLVGYTKATSFTATNCYVSGTFTCPDQVGGMVGLAETSVTLTGCLFGGTLPASATNCDPIIGKQAVAATVSNCSAVADADKADYATASKIASKLGWSTDVWDLSGDAPVLK